MSLRLGYKASAEQFGPNELLEYSILAEQRGFDSVFISDHFQPWRHTDGHAPFSMAWMGALGARTSRITMGTSVLTPTFRYHPSVVAQAFGTLGVMFPGRVILGVGTGESLNEVPATGLAWPEPKERTARLKEALALIRQLWSEQRVSFKGQYYRTDKATIYDRPSLAPPIYVAAAGPVLAKYAGQFADGFICTSGKAPELYRDTLLPSVTTGIQAADRTPEDIDMMIEMKVSFDSDPQRAVGRHPPLGRARALARGEDFGRGSAGNGTARGSAPGRTRGQALDRVDGSGGARGTNQALSRPGFQAPGVSCARLRSGAVSESLRRSGLAPAAGGVCLDRDGLQIILPRNCASLHCPAFRGWRRTMTWLPLPRRR